MKQIFLSVMFFFVISFCAKSQAAGELADITKVILENDRLKVTEYISSPGNDVCRKGTHTHEPHLTIPLTDAKVKLSTPDGKAQDLDLKKGTAFWSEAETHFVINSGNKIIKAYLVVVK